MSVPVHRTRSVSANERHGSKSPTNSVTPKTSRSRQTQRTGTAVQQRIDFDGQTSQPQEQLSLDIHTLKAALNDLKTELKSELKAEIQSQIDDRIGLFVQTQSRSPQRPDAQTSDPEGISPPVTPVSVQSLPTRTFPTIAQRQRHAFQVDHKKTARQLCKEFIGSTSDVPIAEWLTVFETVTIEYSDQERLYALTRHLNSEALTWYARSIAPIVTTITWTECRTKMLKRFGRFVTDCVIQAMDRRLQPKDTVLSYFNEMMTLLSQSDVTEKVQVALLTRGMPESFRSHIVTHNPQTTDHWIELALALEETKSKRFNKPHEGTLFTQRKDKKLNIKKPFNDYKTGTRQFDFSKPPRKPCPNCTGLGERSFYWRKFCPRLRANQENQKSTQELQVKTGTTHAISSQVNEEQQSDGSQTGKTETMSAILEPDYVYLDVDVNGHRFRPFLDSGSTLTAMTLNAAQKAGLSPDTSTSKTIRQVNGTLKTLGLVEPMLRIRNKSMRFPIQVLNSFAFDMLLGIDCAKAFGLKVYFGNIGSNSYSLQATEDSMLSLRNETIDDFINRFDIFAKGDKDICRMRNTQHFIRLKPGSAPIYKRPYRLSPPKEQELRKHIEELLDKGLIRRSKSAYGFPMFLVERKSVDRDQ